MLGWTTGSEDIFLASNWNTQWTWKTLLHMLYSTCTCTTCSFSVKLCVHHCLGRGGGNTSSENFAHSDAWSFNNSMLPPPPPQTHTHTHTHSTHVHVANTGFRFLQEKTTLRVETHTCTVFSPAYLRHVGPASLQYRYFFDVGKERGQTLWCNHKPRPPVMPWLNLGENTECITTIKIRDRAKHFLTTCT